jgi:hypothetical protein
MAALTPEELASVRADEISYDTLKEQALELS